MNVETEQPIEVTTTGELKDIVIPFKSGQEESVKQELQDTMLRFAELVHHEFPNHSLEDLKACIPNNIVFKEEKKVRKTKKRSITLGNWESAETMDELKDLKGVNLKDILKEKGMKTSGSKEKLIERVWSINHPDQVTVTPKKKRGRPKGSTGKKNKTKTHTVVSDTDDETNVAKNDKSDKSDTESQEDVEELLVNATETTMSDGKTMYIVLSKNWVFSKDNDGDFDWEGMLNDDGQSYSTCDPPSELMKLYED
jgi:hypothetical protein